MSDQYATAIRVTAPRMSPCFRRERMAHCAACREARQKRAIARRSDSIALPSDRMRSTSDMIFGFRSAIRPAPSRIERTNSCVNVSRSIRQSDMAGPRR